MRRAAVSRVADAARQVQQQTGRPGHGGNSAGGNDDDDDDDEPLPAVLAKLRSLLAAAEGINLPPSPAAAAAAEPSCVGGFGRVFVSVFVAVSG